jgi:hypothetical protein
MINNDPGYLLSPEQFMELEEVTVELDSLIRNIRSNSRIGYLAPTLQRLQRTPARRWAINGTELNSGDTFETKINGDWVLVQLEHDGKDYYPIPTNVELTPGMETRWPEPF